MSLFEWDEIYSVGVELIDNQHKTLFDIGNRFADAFQRGADRRSLAGIFNELLEYTGKHFADEERLMQNAGFPDYARHKENHEKLVSLVLGYKRQFEGNEPGVEQAAMNFIKTWLTGHVLGMDRNYGPFLRRSA
jgi:hemerythrin-like metal-binding protein